MTGYEYSRSWFDFAFENPEKVTGNHAAIYLWNVELCNRMGWANKFASPASQAMAAAGIKSYNTYIKIFNELANWGFINVIQASKNQFSANIIALSKFDNTTDKALDKALTKHLTKQSESSYQSISSINKQTNKETIKPLNHYRAFAHLKISIEEFDKLVLAGWNKEQIDDILDAIENHRNNKNYKSLYLTALKWLKNSKEKSSAQKETIHNGAQPPSKVDQINHGADQAYELLSQKKY